MSDEQLILDFMQVHSLMVISSLHDDNKPQSAVVGFGQTDQLELIFGTSKNSRKAKNILNNPNVCAVIGWDASGTIQYEGTATILSGEDTDKYSKLYFRKHPEAKQYKDDPKEVYFLIKPKWIRFTEFGQSSWVIHELKF